MATFLPKSYSNCAKEGQKSLYANKLRTGFHCADFRASHIQLIFLSPTQNFIHIGRKMQKTGHNFIGDPMAKCGLHCDFHTTNCRRHYVENFMRRISPNPVKKYGTYGQKFGDSLSKVTAVAARRFPRNSRLLHNPIP